jgi:hypothetical protein
MAGKDVLRIFHGTGTEDLKNYNYDLKERVHKYLTWDLEQRSCTEELRAPEELLACILKITKI